MNKIKTRINHKPLPEYTYLGCVMTRNRSPWCFRICQPDNEGIGQCGRYAPHAMMGRIQLGILEFEKRKYPKKNCPENNSPGS
jgi:hypothetical protein